MKNTVITSILATFAISFFALFDKSPLGLFKRKLKISSKKRTTPILLGEEKEDLFI